MRFGLRERLWPMLVLGALAAALPALVHVFVGQTKVDLTGQVHFYAVGFSALGAAAAPLA